MRPVVPPGVLRFVVRLPAQRPARPPSCCERIEHPTYLYVSHLHADHLDEPWLADHVSRDTTVLLPGYPTREQERGSATSASPSFVRTRDGEPSARSASA